MSKAPKNMMLDDEDSKSESEEAEEEQNYFQ